MLSNLSFAPIGRSTPPRRDSSPNQNSDKTAIFLALDDDLRDIRRVHSQGQEEDLRHALDRVVKRVEEFSSLLKEAYKTQTELETSLNLAKSNLQLVISNNEMLEEALKRDNFNGKDVGWRRWSAREVQHRQASLEEERPRSLDYGNLNEEGTPSQPSSASSVNGTKQSSQSPSPVTTPPPAAQDTRFFKFRFNSGTRSPAHLTSPSLPTLISTAKDKELEELQEQLERERKAHQTTSAGKAALESELESLSQALFEEANRMVASERIKCAETEEELREVRSEKEALRETLRLIAQDNGLRVNSVIPATFSDDTILSSSLSSHSRSSSREAMKSPPLLSPSTDHFSPTLDLSFSEKQELDDEKTIGGSSYFSDAPEHPIDSAPVTPPTVSRPHSPSRVPPVETNEPTDGSPVVSSSINPPALDFISEEPSPWASVASSNSPPRESASLS